jgi:hypothetical protein
LDFHHYKDLEVDRVETGDHQAEIQEEIVVQEDRTMGRDMEDQDPDQEKENLLEMQMIKVEHKDLQDQDLVEQKVDLV